MAEFDKEEVEKVLKTMKGVFLFAEIAVSGDSNLISGEMPDTISAWMDIKVDILEAIKLLEDGEIPKEEFWLNGFRDGLVKKANDLIGEIDKRTLEFKE